MANIILYNFCFPPEILFMLSLNMLNSFFAGLEQVATLNPPCMELRNCHFFYELKLQISFSVLGNHLWWARNRPNWFIRCKYFIVHVYDWNRFSLKQDLHCKISRALPTSSWSASMSTTMRLLEPSMLLLLFLFQIGTPRYVPRAVLVDLEPGTMDSVRYRDVCYDRHD